MIVFRLYRILREPRCYREKKNKKKNESFIKRNIIYMLISLIIQAIEKKRKVGPVTATIKIIIKMRKL